MHFIDTHFHLDLWNDPKEILRRIESNKIYTIAVTNTPSVYHYTHEIASGSKYVRAALGLHPELIFERYKEVNQFIQLIESTRYIGEVGLDFSSSNLPSKELQVRTFEKIVETCGSKKDKILTIHSRKAEKEVIDILGSNFPGKVILHWYSGSKRELNRAIKAGYYISVNYSMTQSKNGRSLILEVPKKRLLTESDGPFINHKNEPFSPLRISEIVEVLATLLKISQIEMQSIIFQNMKCLLDNE